MRLYFITDPNPIYSKNIIVPFNKILDSDELIGEDEDGEQYNKFTITLAVKKTYAKKSDFICEQNNKILNFVKRDYSQRFIYNYFTIKRAIDTGVLRNKTMFMQSVSTELFTEEFIIAITKYIDKHYDINIDKQLEENTKQKYDPGMTFSDRHCKILHAVAFYV